MHIIHFIFLFSGAQRWLSGSKFARRVVGVVLRYL